MEKEPPHLISEGSYGCVYHPSVSCKSNKTNSKFITKIQRYVNTSEKESLNSKKIKKIRNYRQYFGPIESSCFLSISKIQNEEIKKCEFIMEKPSEKFLSNRIRYVGSNTLGEYLTKQIKLSPKKWIRNVFLGYLHLLKALVLLEKAKMVHLDLKENNILIDQVSNEPIVIDFGLSFSYEDVNDNDNLEQQRKVFFTYATDYIPWCIDISMITFIRNIESMKEIVTMEQIQTVINDYMTKNPVMEFYSSEEKTDYQKRLQTYYSQWVGKTWTEMVSAIKIASIDTWDNYSLAAIYLENLLHMRNEPVVLKMIGSLKQILLATPDQRPTSRESYMTHKKLLKNIYKSEYNEVRVMKNPEWKNVVDFIENKQKKTKMDQIERENQMLFEKEK